MGDTTPQSYQGCLQPGHGLPRQHHLQTRQGDWKLVKTRPEHLRLPDYDNEGRLHTITEEEGVFEDDFDDPTYNKLPDGPITRSTRTRVCGDAPPNRTRNTRDGDGPPTVGTQMRSGIKENAPEPRAEGDRPLAIRETACTGEIPMAPTLSDLRRWKPFPDKDRTKTCVKSAALCLN